MISSAAVQFIQIYMAWEHGYISVLSLSCCQETLRMSLHAGSWRCFCLKLRPDAVRKILFYLIKCTPATLGLVVDRACPSGYGWLDLSAPFNNQRAIVPWSCCYSTSTLFTWSSGGSGQTAALEQDLGMLLGGETRICREVELGINLPQLGSLLRLVLVRGRGCHSLTCWDGRQGSARRRPHSPFCLKACFWRKVSWVRICVFCCGVSLVVPHLLWGHASLEHLPLLLRLSGNNYAPGERKRMEAVLHYKS